jgi:hypothetical protein
MGLSNRPQALEYLRVICNRMMSRGFCRSKAKIKDKTVGHDSVALKNKGEPEASATGGTEESMHSGR